MKYIIPYYLFLNEATSKEIIQHWKSKIPSKILDTFKRIVDNNVQFLDKICSLYDDGNDDDKLIVPFASITKAKKLNDPIANKIKSDDIQNLTNLISITKPLLDKDIYFAANSNKYKNYDGGKLTYKKLQDDDKALLISYNSVTDCVYFGDERGWCTGDTTLRIFNNGAYAEGYLNAGDIYFIVDKKRYNENSKDIASCMQLSIKRNGQYEFRGQNNKKVTQSASIFKDYLKQIGVNMSKIPLPDDLLDMSKFHPQLHDFLDILPLNNRQKSNLNVTPDGKKIILDNMNIVLDEDDILSTNCDVKTFLDNTQFSEITIDLQHTTYTKTKLMKELEKHNTKFKIINKPENDIQIFDDVYDLEDCLFDKDTINGDFKCNYIITITNIKGSSKNIYGDFTLENCSKLNSLKDGPEYVKGTYTCNKLKSLKSLEGITQYVDGAYIITNCNLNSLEGLPKNTGAGIFCPSNKLKSLYGSPNHIYNSFVCINNKLTSLKYAPKTVSGDFLCEKNPLTSLEGIPKTIGGDFSIDKSCGFSEDYIRSLSNIKGDVYLK